MRGILINLRDFSDNIDIKIRRAAGLRRVKAWATVPSPWLLFPSGTGLQSWSPEGHHLWCPGEGAWPMTILGAKMEPTST